jgi:hypothetical protein
LGEPKARAALLVYDAPAVGGFTLVYHAPDGLLLLQRMHRDIEGGIHQLLLAYGEHLNFGGADDYLAEYRADDPPPDGWDWEDAEATVLDLMARRIEELRLQPRQSILGDWYSLWEGVNCVWPDPDFLAIPIENNIRDFVLALAAMTGRDLAARKVIRLLEGQWIKRIRDMAACAWWMKKETRAEVFALFEEFNENHSDF